MTLKLVVLYTQPDDPDAFDRYYLETHMPLVAKIPGLQRAETARFDAALDGSEKTYHRMAELYFAGARLTRIELLETQYVGSAIFVKANGARHAGSIAHGRRDCGRAPMHVSRTVE